MSTKLFISDLLKLSTYQNCKIKFNLNNSEDDPIDLYASNPDLINTQWLFWRNKQRNFNVGQIAICLVRMSGHFWLLTTIKKVTKELNVLKGINYAGEELEEYAPLYGRTIIKYHKKAQTTTYWAEKIIDDLEVVQILPSVFDGKEFPGYDSVRLSFYELENIVVRHKRDWVAAFEHQKAVYLIGDKSNGKCYVGSATGDNGMLLQRWSNYIKNGHGGNIELKEVVESRGFDYIKENFEYSILENYNSRVDKKYILERESWWKDTLGTRVFGYNSN